MSDPWQVAWRSRAVASVLSLRRNAAWTLLGQVVFAACHWGSFIILGRIAGPEELGRYALALAVVTPIMLFGSLQMRQLQVADATHRYRFGDYLAVRIAGILCAILLILAIAIVGYAWQMAVIFVLVAMAKGFESLSDVHYGIAQRNKRLDVVAQSMILRGIVGILALGSGYVVTGDLAVGLLGMAVAWCLLWWLFDRPMTKRWWALPDLVTMSEPALKRRVDLATTAAPLGIGLMLVALNPNVPRYFIEASVGLKALGMFVAMAQFVVAGRMVIGAVCQAASPRLADLYAAGDVIAFRHLLVRLLAASGLLGLLGLLVVLGVGADILGLIYGPEFRDSADVFVWIMVVGMVAYIQTPLGFGMTAMHQFKVQPLIFGIAVVVNVCGCLLLVPEFGLLGATFGWLGAIVCQLILSAWVHARYMHKRARPATPTTGSVRS